MSATRSYLNLLSVKILSLTVLEMPIIIFNLQQQFTEKKIFSLNLYVIYLKISMNDKKTHLSLKMHKMAMN
jgi:hypothetical protein